MAYHVAPQMSSMAQTPAPAICTNQYSSLQQERMYLLSALAEEEDRGERLTRAYEALRTKQKRLESAEPPQSSQHLKKPMRQVRYKIGTCQRQERALADNLAHVVGQMEALQRYQWRSAQHNYAQQYQHGQMMMMMSPGFAPGFVLQSPMNSSHVPDTQYMSLQPPLTARFNQQYQQQYQPQYHQQYHQGHQQYYPDQNLQEHRQEYQQPYPRTNTYYPTYQSPYVPGTPVVLAQTQSPNPANSGALHAASPAETYTRSEIDELADAISPCDLEFVGINNLPRRRGDTGESNPFPDSQKSTITVAKMPDPDHPVYRVPTTNKVLALTRRFSILGMSSAGVKLDREVANGNQSA